MAPADTTTHLRNDADPAKVGEGPSGVRRGALLGRYTVLEAIGSGGMGNVFAAWDPELRRRVAIKVLHADLMRSDSRRRAQDRLRREAQAAAQLAHPNVVAIYDVGTVGERLFLAMELVEGQTLAAWSAEPRTWRETLEVYRRAGRGLAAAHRADLVHRDFKPGNVMLADDGQVKILDFGLAKAIRSESDEPLGQPTVGTGVEGTRSVGPTTATGQVLGTPRFMSPEQRLGRSVDHRSDQFSFCVALYQALSGRLPFEGSNAGEYESDLLAGRLAARSSEAEVPARILRALERGLEPEPTDRYPSMDALLEDLRPAATATRRRVVALGVAAAVLTVGFFALRRPVAPCDAAGGLLDTTWNSERRGQLEGVFETVGAADTWPRVASGLDSLVAGMRSMYVETCRATHVRREQSVDLFDRRMACLDDRHRALGAMLRLWEQGRPDILATASTAVEGLPGLAACADRRALADLAPPPADRSSAVEAVRGDLADALALELAGQYGEAAPILETALAEAREIDHRPLLGEVQLQRARVAGRLGDSQAMKDTLVDAVAIGLGTHHRELLARSYLQLIVVGFLRGEVDQARVFGRMAEAAISTLEGRQDLEAERLFFLGMISIREGRFEDAVAQYERYLGLGDALSPLERITALGNYAHSLRELGELDKARQALLEAQPLVGELHPRHEYRWSTSTNLGEIYLDQGDLEAAAEPLLTALEGLESVLGPEHPKVANHLQMVGRLHLEGGDFDRAVEVLERATAIHQRTPGYEVLPVERQWLLGQALWRQGTDPESARQWIRRAATATSPGEEETVALATAWLESHEE